MGDIIHTLPALTDAVSQIPGISFDWVVEENFQEIPRWHPAVKKVIPVALRRWRKQAVKTWRSGDWQRFCQNLQEKDYDKVIDAQGLIKSAFLSWFSRGRRYGLDRKSAWESLASLFYQQKISIDPQQHAVTRVRQLFAKALDYEMPVTVADYGIKREQFALPSEDLELKQNQYAIFFHGTTWTTKHWPEQYWYMLVQKAAQQNLQVVLPWGNEVELARAQRIASASPQAIVLPKLNLLGIAGVLAHAKCAVAVDTGLGHLAAALDVPTLSLYGPTNPLLTGTVGAQQYHLAAQFSCAPCLQEKCTYQGLHLVEPPCFGRLPPGLVWDKWQENLK